MLTKNDIIKQSFKDQAYLTPKTMEEEGNHENLKKILKKMQLLTFSDTSNS